MRYYVSKYSIYTFLFCSVYLLQRFFFVSFLNIPLIMLSKRIYLHEVVFLITSFIFVKKSFKIDRLD